MRRVGWSLVVRPDELDVDPGDALDLRVSATLDDDWAASGFSEVVPGELVRPVEQRLVDLAQTRALGRRLAADLGAGDVVLLSGPLGAGKTSLAQGIGEAMGVRGRVTSPTFVLARVHRGAVPLVHVDAYRLRDAGGRIELDDLDLDADVEDSVTVIEWGEGLAEVLADSRLEVHLARPHDGRTARVVASGPRWSVLREPMGAIPGGDAGRQGRLQPN